jgi:hypothetical protein
MGSLQWRLGYIQLTMITTFDPAQEAAALRGKHSDLQHIATALQALDQVLGTLKQRDDVPFYGPTLLASMNELDQRLAVEAEQARYGAQPEHSALQFCVTAAIALMEVSQALIHQAQNPTPQERERQWKTLVAYTKTAGRSAYRAASILTDQKDY